MKQPDIRKYLFDVQQAGGLILRFCASRNFADYRDDPMLKAAVERQFEIIGEALQQALRVDSSIEQRISHFRRIVALRNRLIHAYASIADEIIWGVVETDLSVLMREVGEILSERASRE